VSNGSTGSKGSESPEKEHPREEHSENATFPIKRQKKMASNSSAMTEMLKNRMADAEQ
jgi:hypothetical protein